MDLDAQNQTTQKLEILMSTHVQSFLAQTLSEINFELSKASSGVFLGWRWKTGKFQFEKLSKF